MGVGSEDYILPLITCSKGVYNLFSYNCATPPWQEDLILCMITFMKILQSIQRNFCLSLKVTGLICQQGIQELLSSILNNPLGLIRLNESILDYGLKVRRGYCLEKDGEDKKKWRMIVSWKGKKQLHRINRWRLAQHI